MAEDVGCSGRQILAHLPIMPPARGAAAAGFGAVHARPASDSRATHCGMLSDGDRVGFDASILLAAEPYKSRCQTYSSNSEVSRPPSAGITAHRWGQWP